MTISITQDLLPFLAQAISWTLLVGGLLFAFLILLFDDWGELGKVLTISLLIAAVGGLCCFFLEGGSITI